MRAWGVLFKSGFRVQKLRFRDRVGPFRVQGLHGAWVPG